MQEEFTIINISAKIFSGFQYKIPKEICKNMEINEIILETKNYMKNFFKIHNMWILEKEVDNLNLHCHNIDYNNLYLCDHV